jgi:hypothetical protein
MKIKCLKPEIFNSHCVKPASFFYEWMQVNTLIHIHAGSHPHTRTYAQRERERERCPDIMSRLHDEYWNRRLFDNILTSAIFFPLCACAKLILNAMWEQGMHFQAHELHHMMYWTWDKNWSTVFTGKQLWVVLTVLQHHIQLYLHFQQKLWGARNCISMWCSL